MCSREPSQCQRFFRTDPVKNDQAHNRIDKTRLKNGRNIILNRSGRPFYSGNLDLGHCLDHFDCHFKKHEICKNKINKIHSIPPNYTKCSK